MSDADPQWAKELSGQAQTEQALASVRPLAVLVAQFYRTLREQGLSRDVAAGLTATWLEGMQAQWREQ